MASRTGLMPAKVKQDMKTKMVSRKSLQAPKPKLSKPATVSHIRDKQENARPVHPFKRDLVEKKSTMASKLMKNVVPVGSKDKARLNARKSHPGYVSMERALPKYTTPSRKSLVAGRPTPKSILKRGPDILEAEKPSGQGADNGDSHHVKFKSKVMDQAAMRAKLNAWLEAKGRTSGMSKFRHSSCFNVEPSASASSKRVALLDRTITENLLSQQMKTLNSETVKKQLFPRGCRLSPKDNKENSQQVVKLPSNHALDTNGSATNSTGPDVTDMMTAQVPGSACRIPDSSRTSEIMSSQVLNKIEAMLEESLHLLDAGCPLESVLQWFTEMETSMPETLTLATYYMHKAKIVAAFPQMVLQVFCQAVHNNAQPNELVAAEMKRTFSKWLTPDVSKSCEEIASVPDVSAHKSHGLETATHTGGSHTPKQVKGQQRTSINRVGSTVKYRISSTRRCFIRSASNSTVAVVTPVRRSTRLSGKPALSSDRLRREVNSISDLSSAERQSMLFQMNPALTGK